MFILLLLILVFVTYNNAISVGAGRDFGLVQSKISDPGMKSWATLFSQPHLYPVQNSREYRPLYYLTFWIQKKIFHHELPGYHSFNIFLHFLNCLLLFGVLKTVISKRVAMLASLLFLIHPINTEAVTNLVGRADLLSSFFSLLTWFMYIHSQKNQGRKKLCLVALCVLSLVLGILSKENTISILGVILLTDLLNHYRNATSVKQWIRLVQAQIHFFLVLLFSIPLYLIVRKIFLGLDFSGFPIPFIDNPLAHVTNSVRICTGCWILLKGWGLFLFPFKLSTDYSYNQIPFIESLSDPRLMIVFLVVICCFLFVLLTLKRKKIFFALCVFSYITLYAPVSNILLPIGTIMGERNLYLPGIAVFALMGLAWNSLVGRFQHIKLTILYPLLCLVCALFVFQTRNRNMDYETQEHLWQRQIIVAPQSVRTWNYNSRFAYQNKNYSQALCLLDKAMIIAPNWPINHTLKGFILRDMGLAEEAVQAFTQSIKLGEKRRFVIEACLQILKRGASDDRAMIRFLNVVTQKTDDLKYQMTLLHLLVKNESYDQAFRYLMKWRRERPADFSLFSAEISLLRQNAPGLVLPTIRDYLTIVKNKPAIRLLLATELLKAKQDEEALSILHHLKKEKGLPKSIDRKVTHLLNVN